MFDDYLTPTQQTKLKNKLREAAPYIACGLVGIILGRRSVRIRVQMPECPPVVPEELFHLGGGYFKIKMSNGTKFVTDLPIYVPTEESITAAAS